MSRINEQLKSGIHSVFVLGQRLGFDILPRHFYSAIPDVSRLRSSEAWKTPQSMTGVAGADISTQLAFVQDCCGAEALQERLRRGGIHAEACRENGTSEGYGPVEADLLYCFIATKRPRRIVQVGCGVSTAVILLAAKEAGYQPEVICVEPYPTNYLTRMADKGSIRLIKMPAQEVELELFTNLSSGDLLFIDSTHTVRPGSEVNRMILEVLPRLQPGCCVHFHDIYFPYDYQSSLLTTLFFWGESTLLHAFLIGNQRYSIAASLSMLHHACAEKVQLLLPNYRPASMQNGLHPSAERPGHFPSATYLAVS